MAVTAVSTAAPLGKRRSSGIGILAGLLTLAVASIFFWQQGTFSPSSTVAASEVDAGDCVDLKADDSAPFEITPCSRPHRGEIVAVIEHPDASDPYPGDQVTSVWFEQTCAAEAERYVGDDVQATTLASDVIAPTREAWDDGTHSAVCFVSTADETKTTAESVEGRADDFRRAGGAPISDLAAGDCFSPPEGRNPFDLRSGDLVDLVDCDGSFHGVFFGRADLPFPANAEFPDTEELSEASTSVCSGRFEGHFNVPSSIGYTFRFWRPSRTDWDSGSRQVLCAVLSDVALDAPYTPADYPVLVNLGAGQCFVLLPEQVAKSVSLDDHVRTVICSDPHVGQMIGSGQLPVGDEYPGDLEIERMAGRECSDRFETFVGIPATDSSYGRFPFWFPNERSWAAGDTRYACAILGEEVLTESIQNSRD